MRTKNIIIAATAFICLVGAVWGSSLFRKAQEPINVPAVPTPVVVEPAPVGVFGSAVTLELGDSATYSDGLVAFLKQLDDSRCPQGVQCIRQGELAPVLRLRGGSLTSETELTFGTERGLTGTAGDYAFIVSGVTPRSIALTVTKSANSATSHSDKIFVTSPQTDAVVGSPLTVVGEARGTWYFEASFPVKLLDANGQLLAAVPAQAQSDWMTENFVPFKAELTFEAPTTATGTLVLEKDNPSGLPQNADELRIPVRFSAPTER
ncbi:MAG: Gmad2 immunoglobulin-like domain-containing protein [Patescibacteria group bacterium]|nr:Gmad2 immunoglobulin-like domain-containing protein [Patescibacteria group bacterium]